MSPVPTGGRAGARQTGTRAKARVGLSDYRGCRGYPDLADFVNIIPFYMILILIYSIKWDLF